MLLQDKFFYFIDAFFKFVKFREERSMNNNEVREVVHNIINFVNDEIGRVLVESTNPAWSEVHQTEMLTEAQANTLLESLSATVREAAFSVLQQS